MSTHLQVPGDHRHRTGWTPPRLVSPALLTPRTRPREHVILAAGQRRPEADAGGPDPEPPGSHADGRRGPGRDGSAASPSAEEEPAHGEVRPRKDGELS